MELNLLRKKEGISDIIVSLIMIVIVLGAIAVVWVLIKGFIGGGTEQVNLGTKCLNLDIKPTGLKCSGTNNAVCDVVVERGTGGEDIAGVKLIFTNSSEAQNYVYDFPGNINVLETKSASSVSTGITNANKVELVVYFNDSSRESQLCSGRSSFSKS